MRERLERTAAERRVRVRCANWESFLDLHTKNISRGGLFVRTDHPAAPGTNVEVELSLPDGRTLTFDGEVAHAVDADEAERRQCAAGMGVRLVHMGTADQLELETVLHELGVHENEAPSQTAAPHTPSGDDDFEDPDLLDALQNYLETLRGPDPLQAIGMSPDSNADEIDARMETLADRFAPEWYFERSPEVRAAAAEVALALRNIHLRIRAGLGEPGAPEDDVEGLSAGRLFGDLEFLDQRSRLPEDSVEPATSGSVAEWIHQGVALLRVHRYREAHETLKQALQADPSDSICRRDYHLALGHDLREAGRIDEAMESFAQALRADPDCVEADAALRGLADSRKRGGKKGPAILGRLLRK